MTIKFYEPKAYFHQSWKCFSWVMKLKSLKTQFQFQFHGSWKMFSWVMKLNLWLMFFFHGWWKIVKMDFMACFHGALLFDMIFKGNSWPMKVSFFTFMGHEKNLQFLQRNFMVTGKAMKIIFCVFHGPWKHFHDLFKVF